MSASSKKKLRNEQAADKLTEKQQSERKQNREVKFYTAAFVTVLAILLVVAVFVGGQRMIANSGIRERRTVAYTVGEHELSNADMSYFFVNTVSNFNNQMGSFAAMMGLDLSKPLDEQYVDEEKTTTWADDFMNSAKESAKAVYAMYDAAVAAGHTLTEDDQAQLDNGMASLELYANISGAGSVKNYLKAMYGPGATEENYRAYLEASILADSYNRAHAESLTFEDSQLREAEKENYNAYSSFTYSQYYLDAAKFLTGGTAAEDGTVTYSQEEKDAAAKAAEEAVKTLTAAKTADELDQAIAALEVNQNAAAASTLYTDAAYHTLSAETAQWLADSARKAGNTVSFPNNSTSTDEEGKEITTTNGFTVVMYHSTNENKEILPNVRHILVNYEGGTANEQGQTVHSDEEKAAAMAKAEEILTLFNEGDGTEEAFAALAAEKSEDPGSKDNGGLYENVYPGQMVPTFNDWVFAEGRKAGDTGIIESDFGCHVMYYCGNGTMNYRDLQLTNELTSSTMEEWYHSIVDAAVTVDGDLSHMPTDMVISRG